MYQAIGNFYEGIMVTGTVSDTTASPFHASCSPNFIAVCGKLSCHNVAILVQTSDETDDKVQANIVGVNYKLP
jgi:hypothetical protein